jgi:hypothetical protein
LLNEHTILGRAKIECVGSLGPGIPPPKMSTPTKYNPFGNMNRSKPTANPIVEPNVGYRSWKNKEVTATGAPIKKEVNLASFTDFPDLVKNEPKKTAFEGVSLASKLKEVIAAEEEAAILKRLKKGDTPEMIFRESCVSLPLKNYKGEGVEKEFKAPWWVTDTTMPVRIPRFHPRSLEEIALERRYKRYGLTYGQTFFDNPNDEEDVLSLPSMPDDRESLFEEELPEQLEVDAS